MDEAALRKNILVFLEACSHLSLATQDQGRPHAASVFFVSIDFDLFFLSSPNSLHSRHIVRNPQVAATVNQEFKGWQDISGLQINGRADDVGGILQNMKLARAYVGKFPDVKDFLLSPQSLGEVIAQKVARVRFYRLRPSRITFVNNALGFGHKDELILAD